MNNYTKKVKGWSGKYMYFNANGEVHRLDGPAAELMDEYFINGTLYSEKDFKKHPDVVKYSKVQLLKKLIKGK